MVTPLLVMVLYGYSQMTLNNLLTCTLLCAYASYIVLPYWSVHIVPRSSIKSTVFIGKHLPVWSIESTVPLDLNWRGGSVLRIPRTHGLVKKRPYWTHSFAAFDIYMSTGDQCIYYTKIVLSNNLHISELLEDSQVTILYISLNF